MYIQPAMTIHPPEPGYAWLEPDACWINLSGDYDYLTGGYYLSQELELKGEPVHPTTGEVLDAYVTPLFLQKAEDADLPVLPWYITNGYFEPPVLIDTMNPFMNRQKVVRSQEQQDRSAKSLTRNYTYAVCVQELPEGARIRHFQGVLGWSSEPSRRQAAREIWELFRIPIAKIRVVEAPDGTLYHSGLWPLAWSGLKHRERRHLEETLTWRT